MSIEFELNDKKSFAVVSVYAPNESDNTDVKEEFWTKLQDLVKRKQGTLIIGRVGNNKIGSKKYISRFRKLVLNSNEKL